jgi:hypothetical protein
MLRLNGLLLLSSIANCTTNNENIKREKIWVEMLVKMKKKCNHILYIV